MLKDLRLGVRMLLRDKGWTLVVLVSLALGIGANTALFSAANGLLLKELPIRDPDALVRFRYVGRNEMVTESSDYGTSNQDSGRDVRTTFSYPMFRQFLDDNRTLSDLFACAPYGRINVVVDGHADIATAFISTGNYYRLLGATVSRGRTIAPEDDQPSAPPVATISARYWRTRFGSDPGIVGRTVQLNNLPVTVVGVIAPGFTGVQRSVGDEPDVAVPLALDARITPPGPGQTPRVDQPTSWWLQIMGRLKPGVTAPQVQANFANVFQETARAGLASYAASLSESARSTMQMRNRRQVPQLKVDSGRRGIYDASAADLRAVSILGAVVILVLLIVCANVANLLLSRATSRRKEISIRLSMGATRARLVRQLLTESLLLASLGGGLGVLVARWGQPLLPGVPGRATAMDWRVLAFTVVITIVTGLAFGIAPALRATGMNVSAALKETSRSVSGSRSLLGRALLVVQVAVSLVLLVGAGLFLRTLQNLRHEDVGFNPDRLILFRVNPQLNGYDDARTAALYRDLSDRLSAVAGVRSVALSQTSLLSGGVSSTGIFIQGRTYTVDRGEPINVMVVSPSFFETMEIPVVSGRGLTAADTDNAPKVVVINEAAARAYYPDGNPIGRRFGSSVEQPGELEVVGVLRDTKYSSLREPAPPTMYLPYTQRRMRAVVFEVRTAGGTATVLGGLREAVRQIDSNLPMTNVSTQMEQIEGRLVEEKVLAQAYTLFGCLAVVLASIGLFGLMSYSVSRRTNEIGIRLALGAQRGDVMRLLMGESMALVSIGIGAGLLGVLAAGRLVASLLFGLGSTDAATMALAAALMLVVSALAGYLPARRASRVDPLVALHYE